MNWTPANIFDARDRLVSTNTGKTATVKLHEDGWAFAGSLPHSYIYKALDIWAACRWLNDHEAHLIEQ